MSDDEYSASDEEIDEVEEVTDLSNRYVLMSCIRQSITVAHRVFGIAWYTCFKKKMQFFDRDNFSALFDQHSLMHFRRA